jgi:AcrR family transcriptional regulator
MFVDKGFHETTVEEISAVVGVTKRTFFLHFASKDEVLLGHVAEQLELLRSSLTSVPPHPDPFARVGEAVTSLAGQMQDREDLLLQLDLVHRVPRLLAVSLEQFTAFEDAIADAVRLWRREESRRRLTDADNAYAQLVGTVGIAALRAGLTRWRRKGGTSSLADLVAAQVETVATGMRPPWSHR